MNPSLGSPGDSARIHRMWCEIELALRAAAAPILVSGPSRADKSELLRTLWWTPPRGFAPLLAPIGGLCALVRLPRPQESTASDPLLLIDELQAIPLATLSKLAEIVLAPRSAVRLVATGTDGDALEYAAAALPRSTHRIHFSGSDDRAEAERRARMLRRRHRRRGLGWI